VTTILLARHGETDWNRQLRIQGHADQPLNELGREQARELARSLGDVPLSAVYSSDLSRAVETAEIVAREHELPVRIDAGLREIDVGSWEGLTRDEVLERFPDHQRPDGETREVHRERVVAALTRIARAHPGEQVLVVTHGGSMRAAWVYAGAGEPVGYPNCGVFSVAWEDGVFRRVD
jgi:broad specificity phosphatase PhoE